VMSRLGIVTAMSDLCVQQKTSVVTPTLSSTPHSEAAAFMRSLQTQPCEESSSSQGDIKTSADATHTADKTLSSPINQALPACTVNDKTLKSSARPEVILKFSKPDVIR